MSAQIASKIIRQDVAMTLATFGHRNIRQFKDAFLATNGGEEPKAPLREVAALLDEGLEAFTPESLYYDAATLAEFRALRHRVLSAVLVGTP